MHPNLPTPFAPQASLPRTGSPRSPARGGKGAFPALLASAALALAAMASLPNCTPPRTQAPPAPLEPHADAPHAEQAPDPAADQHHDGAPAVADQPADPSTADAPIVPPGTPIRFVGTEPGYAVLVEDSTLTVTGEIHDPWSLDGVEHRHADGQHTIHAEGDGRSVHIVWTQAICNDGMSDIHYPWTATVTLDDVPHHGCGAPTDNWPTISFIVDGRPVDFDAPCAQRIEGIDVPVLAAREGADGITEVETSLTPIALDDAGTTFLLRLDDAGSTGLRTHSVLQRCTDGGYRTLFGPHQAESITAGERPPNAPFADLVVLSRHRASATCDAPLHTILSWQHGAYRPASVTCAPGGPAVWEDDCRRPPPTCP